MKNVGKMDRTIRLAVFAVLLGTGFLVDGGLRWTSWALSVVMLVTATAGFCPLWALFKINTVEHR